jgi:hypothetical protein
MEAHSSINNSKRLPATTPSITPITPPTMADTPLPLRRTAPTAATLVLPPLPPFAHTIFFPNSIEM